MTQEIEFKIIGMPNKIIITNLKIKNKKLFYHYSTCKDIQYSSHLILN